MDSRALEKLRECCKNMKSYLIIYDGAGTPDLPVLVCNTCFQNNLFQKFVKTKMPVTEYTDLKSLSENQIFGGANKLDFCCDE